MKTLPWLVSIALGVVALQGQCAQRELDHAIQERDSLRTVVLEERTAAQGWRTQLVQATSGLEAELMEARDREGLLGEEKAELAREIQALGGRLAIMADLYAGARGQLTARAELHGDEEVPDSITAPIDDGLLEGRISYRPLPRVFDLEYSVGVALTAAVSEAPDGRGLITLMATDPRVSLSYGEVLYQQPEPVRYCSLGQRGRHWLEGAVVSELFQITISSLIPQE